MHFLVFYKDVNISISRSILLRMRNVSDVKVVEKVKTHLMFKNIFRKITRL
jgi:hypothetical protein